MRLSFAVLLSLQVKGPQFTVWPFFCHFKSTRLHMSTVSSECSFTASWSYGRPLAKVFFHFSISLSLMWNKPIIKCNCKFLDGCGQRDSKTKREKRSSNIICFQQRPLNMFFRLACGRFLRNCSQKKCDKFGMSGDAGTSNRALMLSGHHENGVLQLIMIPLLVVFF